MHSVIVAGANQRRDATRLLVYG